MASAFDEARLALYAASPADFVARRKELSAALKSAGDPGGARLLGAMPKPNAPAWAVNHLYRAGALAKVMQAGHENRRAQGNMAAGKLDAKGAREAQDAHRAALAEAGRLAWQALTDAGLGGTDAVELPRSSCSCRRSRCGWTVRAVPRGLPRGRSGVAVARRDARRARRRAARGGRARARAEGRRSTEGRRGSRRDRRPRGRGPGEGGRGARAPSEGRRARSRPRDRRADGGRLRDARDAHAVARHRHERARTAVAEAEAVLAKVRDAAAHAEGAAPGATEGMVEGAEREAGAAQGRAHCARVRVA